MMNDWLDTHGEALDAMYEGWPHHPPRYECILCGELYNDFEMVAGEDTCIHCWEGEDEVSQGIAPPGQAG